MSDPHRRNTATLEYSSISVGDRLTFRMDGRMTHRRAHAALEGRTPVPTRKDVARLDCYRWQAHCRGLYQTPVAA